MGLTENSGDPDPETEPEFRPGMETSVAALRFDSAEKVVDWLYDQGVDTCTMARCGLLKVRDGHLVVRKKLCTEKDPVSGRIRFTRHGVYNTAEWLEDNF